MAGYRRTISFPAPKPSGTTDLASASDKLAAYRVRSASLPCRFHPLVLQLDDDVAALRLVLGRSPPSPAVASSVSAAASQVARVLVSLSELLNHPQVREPLRRLGARSPLAERLLDDFLRLADAHGSFRQALVALAALQAETRATRDLPSLAAAVRAVAGKPPRAIAGGPARRRRGTRGRGGRRLGGRLLRPVRALELRRRRPRRGRVHGVLEKMETCIWGLFLLLKKLRSRLLHSTSCNA